MIPWVRILLYFSIFTLIIIKLRRKDSHLTPIETAAAFALKVIMGCAYGYIHLRFYNGDDTWLYNNESLHAYQQLKTHPSEFFGALWPSHLDGFTAAREFITRNLEHELMIRLIALFNFFTAGNYYLNTVFFNFIVFWGHYWLFTFLIARYPTHKLPLLIAVFFVPTIVFWLSGIRGDGFVLFFLALLFYQYYNCLTRYSISYLLYGLLCMLGIFLFRSAVLFVVFPFLVGWYLVSRHRVKPIAAYAFTYLFCTVIFFGSALIHPERNLPAMIANKQRDFIDLPGKTRFDIMPLTSSPASYIKAAPMAIVNTLARPFIWEARGFLQMVTALETTIFLLSILCIAYFVDWKTVGSDPWILGGILFSLSLFLFIGLTIPFPGAIIRYKAIPQLFLLLSLLPATRIRKNNIS
jgi:hypothetical protein